MSAVNKCYCCSTLQACASRAHTKHKLKPPQLTSCTHRRMSLVFSVMQPTPAVLIPCVFVCIGVCACACAHVCACVLVQDSCLASLIFHVCFKRLQSCPCHKQRNKQNKGKQKHPHLENLGQITQVEQVVHLGRRGEQLCDDGCVPAHNRKCVCCLVGGSSLFDANLHEHEGNCKEVK